MTIQEKAIEQLERISNHLSAIGEKEDYTDIAIQALEQEQKTDVLDKIRAEINSQNRGTCDYFIVDRIEEIIDKYKAESEG